MPDILSPSEWLQQQSPSVVIPQEAPGQPGRVQLAAQNNNPGNLRNTDGSWKQYSTPAGGYADLQGKIRAHAYRGDTLENYLSAYAPPNENDTEGYIQNAEKALGVPRGTRLTALDREKLAQFQAKQESSTRVAAKPSGIPSPSEFLADPLNHIPDHPSKLPSQAEFDASHKAAVAALPPRNAQGQVQSTRPGIAQLPPLTEQQFQERALGQGNPPESAAGPVIEGITKAAAGFHSLATGKDLEGNPYSRIKAAREAIAGILDTLTPGMAAAAVAAPLEAAATLAVGMGAQAGVEKLGEKAGLSPDAAGLTGDVAGLVAGGVAGHGLARGRAPRAAPATENAPPINESPAATSPEVVAKPAENIPENIPPAIPSPSEFLATEEPSSLTPMPRQAEPTKAPEPSSEAAPAEKPPSPTEFIAQPPHVQEAGTVAQIPTKDINLDPVRFQFKQNVGARGVSDKLADVSTWDPDLAGMTHVWRDDLFGNAPEKQQGGLFDSSIAIEAQRQAQLIRQEEPDAKLSEVTAKLQEEYPGVSKAEAVKMFMRSGTGEKGAITINPKAVQEAYKRSSIVELGRSARDFMSPLSTRIEREAGGAGEALVHLLRRAGDAGEVHAGQMLVRLADVKSSKLNHEQRFEVLDVLEGRQKESSDPRVTEVSNVMRRLDDELAGQASALGVEIRTSEGKRPFAAMENHFPHVLRAAAALKSGPVRRDIIENLQRLKIRPDKESAAAFLDDWVGYLESGQRRDSLLQHLVDSGQAADKAEALAKLQRFRSKIERHGSLEYARELNLPFYDPDPVRVMPYVVAAGAKRLAQIGHFGQEHQKINAEILKISNAGGNADFVRQGVDRIIGVVSEGNTAEVRISRFLRSVETFKMGLSAIPNATQGVLNSMVSADLPTVALGLRDAMTKRGRRLAIESGATIDPVLSEARKELGGGRKADLFLKGTGFNATEEFNRATAANVGTRWASKNFEVLQKNSGNKAARAHLEELGVDPAAALSRGSLTPDDKLMAAKKFADMTQFRARPEDMPLFASTPLGRVAFQFKSFAYNQARLIAKETVGEIRAGRPGRALRTMLVVGTLFPAAGELVRILRNGITGNEQDLDDGIEQYLYDLSQAGTLGILQNAVQSAESKRALEFIAGPAAGDLAHVAEIFGDTDTDSGQKADALTKYVIQRFGGPLRSILNSE